MRFPIALLSLGLFSAPLCYAQFMTELQPKTADQFEAYAGRVESTLERRWHGKLPFLVLDENPAARADVLKGELWIQPGDGKNPISIPGGLIHDWVGAVFIPHADMATVLEVMQNFDRHSHIYPEVKSSRLISRKEGEIKGQWRLQRKQAMVTAVLDVTQDAHWQQVAPGKWICRGYAKNISEVQHAGTSQEVVLPPGHGRGFMWRLYAYWSLQAVDGGVLGECRTMTLSRDIPAALSFIIKPLVQSLPRDSLSSSLSHTRDAAEK